MAVKLREPQFEGQTKTKLGNTEMRSAVETTVNDKLMTWLEENPTEVAREGDAVVEGVRLVVDHDDLACDVQLAQLLGAVCPGCAVPNDHEAGGIRAQLVLLFARCSLLCRNAAQVARAACSRSEVLPLLA